MKELEILFDQAYKAKALKAVQNAMYEDLRVALLQAERAGRLGPSLHQLLSAASKVLPKQKRNALLTTHKKAAVMLKRTGGRRETSPEADSDSDTEVPALPSLADLPPEVVESILGGLGPLELARCTCACRCWRDLSRGSERLWRELLELTFPELRTELGSATQQGGGAVAQAAAAPAGPGGAAAPSYVRFRAAVAGRPRALRKWSGRVLSAGRPKWLSAEALRRALQQQPSARSVTLSFPSEQQVVLWALHQPVVETASSSSDEESSEDEAGVDLSAMKLWAQCPPTK